MPSSRKRSVLVTGATGFVGRDVCAVLEARGHDVRRVQRAEASGAKCWQVADLAQDDIPSAAFEGVDTLIHLAASMPGDASDPSGAKTERMAARVTRHACLHGVKRVILLSSVAVRLALERPDQARAYARRKHSAEQAMRAALAGGTHCVILRPPVIYGAGAQGSFALLLGLVRKGVPLPVKNATAPRSYLSRSNLSALLCHLLEASDAQWRAQDGAVFEPHDGAGTATRDLVSQLAQALGHRVTLFALPRFALRWLGKLAGKSDQVEAMFEPLICADIQALEAAFGWTPQEQMPQSLEGLIGSEEQL